MASTMKASFLVSRPCFPQTTKIRQVVCRAANRPTWCPGLPPPDHLKGEVVGDFGYDPLGLAKDPEAFKWYQQAELIHARLAMMGLAGMLIPSVLTKIGILNVPEWYEAGKVAIEGSSIPFNALLMVQVLLCGWVETRRWMDIRKPNSQGEQGSFLGLEGMLKGTDSVGYPGGIFDPFNFAKGQNLEELKLKEIKNGRLSMVACLGFYAQAIATGKGPVDNWLDHISDPWGNNFCTNGVSVPFL